MRQWRSALFAFAISGAPRTLADIGPLHDFENYQKGLYDDPPQQTFKSSNITAPILNYGIWRRDLISSDSSSHLFLTISYNQSGPYIFNDNDLSLVYANPLFDYTMNARVQSVNGTDYLTFWHGARERSDSQGFCVFYDQHYRLVYNVTLSAPFVGDADMHECEVTADGTVLLTAYQDKPFDLSPLGGKVEDVLTDGCFQDVELVSGREVFRWCASEWFAVGLSYWNFSGISRRRSRRREAGSNLSSEGFDAIHINSLQKTAEGNYLVSLHDLKLLTYIDGKTGKLIWTLGGKLNDFEDITPSAVLAANPDSGGALSFGWQHHARFVNHELTQIDMFDNHEMDNAIDCTGTKCSRGRLLQINSTNPHHRTVELIRDFRSPHGLSSVIFGSMQALPDQSTEDNSTPESFLIGWGVSTEFSEHTLAGEVIRDVQYSRLDPMHSFGGTGSVGSYRVFKQSWQGYPTWPPEVAMSEDGSFWVSWNGATQVRSWAVYGSQRAEVLGSQAGSWDKEDQGLNGLSPIKVVKRQGFETEIRYGAALAEWVKVAALDEEGNVIGTTRTLKTGHSPSRLACWYQKTLSFTCLIRLVF